MYKTLHGKYKPKHPNKYKGDHRNIVYRSSWEFKFMKWCDDNDRVIWWMSEEFRIPYYDPVSRSHRSYYPDFFLAYKRSDDIITETLVEVKPKKQVKGPAKNPKKKTKSWLAEVYTYATNQAKWKAAAEWCEDNGANWQLITEKELGLWGK